MMIFKYYCSSCRAEGNAAYASTRFEYVLPDGRLADAPTEIGWCHDCRGLRPIETLERDYWVQAIQMVGQQLTSIKITHRLLRKSLVTFEYDWGDEKLYTMPLDPDVLIRWQDELNRALNGFDFLSLRTRPPHCIGCGGTNFERSGLRHLGCDGTFEGEYAGHILIRGGPRAYQLNVEGEEL